jgi:myo-inositol-1(or 4)-monophosphatase
VATPTDPEHALAVATAAAREAGAVLATGFAGGPAALFGLRHRAATKAGEFDLVTEFDRRSEALLVERLASAFPGDRVIAEEGGGQEGDGATWFVDPLDGTTNFAHGLPFFCVAIGRVVGGRVDLGVVHAPVLDATFTAVRGGGAFCNGKRLAVSDAATLDRAVLGTGFPSDRATSPDNNFAQFMAVKLKVRGVRRYGSAALDLAMVAAGTFDGYWEMKLKPWDLAAGSLLVEEAGGKCTDWHGEPLRLERGAALASNGVLHDQIVALVSSAGEK